MNKIELAVDEACANVIEHAYNKEYREKQIDIAVRIEYQKLTIVVTDQGKGFDPSKLELPNMREYLAEMRVGGLGVFLMKTLMDEVNYTFNPGVKNQVSLIKYLNVHAA